MFMLNNITPKSSMANYNIPVQENPITDSIEITHEPAGTCPLLPPLATGERTFRIGSFVPFAT